MGWRTIVIANEASLHIRDAQLVVRQGDTETPLPVEDIATLILESRMVALTAMALERLVQAGAAVFVCDERHLPCAVLLPYAGHSRLLRTQRLQLAAGLPLRKRCWQALVRAKIANQAACLRLLGRAGADELAALAGAVHSGDPTNVEAQAARRYWAALLGPAFLRGAEDPANAALNYGYAVLRGAVARAIALHGFLPAIGLHHQSEQNPLNLADDLLEPLRPVVDLCVAGELAGATELTKTERAVLVSLLHRDVAVDGARQAVGYAADLLAASLLAALEAGDVRRLRLPTPLPAHPHVYE